MVFQDVQVKLRGFCLEFQGKKVKVRLGRLLFRQLEASFCIFCLICGKTNNDSMGHA